MTSEAVSAQCRWVLAATESEYGASAEQCLWQIQAVQLIHSHKCKHFRKKDALLLCYEYNMGIFGIRCYLWKVRSNSYKNLGVQLSKTSKLKHLWLLKIPGGQKKQERNGIETS